MTINLMESIKKMMGWCPNANAFAIKRALVALPIDEGFAPGEKGKSIQNYSQMGWGNKYRNIILILELSVFIIYAFFLLIDPPGYFEFVLIGFLSHRYEIS